MEDGGAEQHGDGEEEEELQEDMEGEAGDEEVLIDEEQGDDLDETLGEGVSILAYSVVLKNFQ